LKKEENFKKLIVKLQAKIRGYIARKAIKILKEDQKKEQTKVSVTLQDGSKYRGK